ncbi:C39 family peptidase [Candidatus Uhrbacteria bacterium]|nr:C39 family peptidase [Candidatus Uhrbacteria bacterium]
MAHTFQKHNVYPSLTLLLLATAMIGGAIVMLSREHLPIGQSDESQPTTAAPSSPEQPSTNSPAPADDSKTSALLTRPPKNSAQEQIRITVPFFSQAPYGQWDDPRHQDGCEEASAIMAVAWAQQKSWTTQQANTLIEEIAAYQERNFGNYHDTSVEDTAERILKGYFTFSNFEVQSNVTVTDIRTALEAGNIVIIPADGKKLKNPYFTNGGPERHMLVVIGYNPSTNQFITNDPGTRHGAGYRYSSATIQAAIRDYPSGYHEPITSLPTAMIVVHR